MNDLFSGQSASSRRVLTAVLETLAARGWEGLSVAEVTMRAGTAGAALGDSPDLESLVGAALQQVDLFPESRPTGDLRDDLRQLLAPWRRAPTRDERIVAAVLSAALRRPRLKVAVYEVLDGPVNSRVAAIMAQAGDGRAARPELAQTLCWILRALLIDRLRSGPRAAVDIDRLVDFLIAGLDGHTAGPTRSSTGDAPRVDSPPAR